MNRKVGRPPKLSRQQIIDAAIADGLDTFGMSSVARRLEVSHSGLYRYFDDYEALLKAAVESRFESFSWPQPQGVPWRELLTSIGQAAWQFYEENPGIDRVLLTPAGHTDAAEALLIEWANELTQQGFSVEDAGISLNFVLLLAVTTSINLNAIETVHVQDDTPDPHPIMLEIGKSISAHKHGWFDVKLEIFLDGLALRIGQ